MVELPNEVLRENPIMYFILPEPAEQGQKSAYSLEQDTMRFTLLRYGKKTTISWI